MLEQQIAQVLFAQCKVIPGQRILVGFSGGPDSLCLLHLLKKQPVELVAAHFNHRLRDESDADAAKCRMTAEDWGIEYAEEVGGVRDFAADNKLSLEEAARILRYRFLFNAARSHHADTVAVAHQADDQVETVLMHLLRGSGTNGMSGMQVYARDPLGESELPLIRPLLAVWRSEIREYCQYNNLIPLDDATNLDTAYLRNRIRRELIPKLEAYNPEFRQHLWQTASILAEENEQLEAEANVWTSSTLVRSGQGWAIIDISTLRETPLWLRRRLIRKIVFGMRSTLRDVSFEQVDRGVKYLAAPEFSKTCQLTDEIEINKFENESVLFAFRHARLYDLWPQLEASEPIQLSAGVVLLKGGWRFSFTHLENGQGYFPMDDPWTCILDEDRLAQPLTLGSRLPGDVFMPFGLEGKSVKLGDFFTNEHLPTRARDAWPLVRCQGKIVWVPGYRPAEFCKITSNTRRAIRLTLEGVKK